jgi:hypothetical protein
MNKMKPIDLCEMVAIQWKEFPIGDVLEYVGTGKIRKIDDCDAVGNCNGGGGIDCTLCPASERNWEIYGYEKGKIPVYCAAQSFEPTGYIKKGSFNGDYLVVTVIGFTKWIIGEFEGTTGITVWEPRENLDPIARNNLAKIIQFTLKANCSFSHAAKRARIEQMPIQLPVIKREISYELLSCVYLLV